MNLSKFRFTLDLHSIQSQASIPVMVGDTSVNLIISITDGGLPYRIEDGCLAKISIKRPTGTHLEEFCVIKNNALIEYALAQNENTCAVPGVHVCDIILYGADGGVVGTPRFTIVVSERVIRFDDIVLTDEDFTAVEAMIKQEATRQSQETTRQSQEATRQEQERLRVIAENGRAEAEAARTDDYKEAVQAATDAKAEADRAKKYVENFDAGLYTEKDPTVPAWAKKPNPPTAAEVGAAPAGFGVGTVNKMISDPDSVTESGLYQFVSDKLTGSLVNWYLISQHHADGYAHQIAINVVYGYELRRTKTNNVLGEWEWVNPTMQLGVEYRTTERYMGKPVYIKAVDCGEMPSAGTHKNITVSTGLPYGHKTVGMECVFESEPYGEYGLKRCCVNYCTETDNSGEIKGIAWTYSIDSTISVTIKALGDITNYSAVATVKYVK